MSEKAFKTLGISPTSDGRAIRAAFLRLARIYHPDRLAGMPDDVRAEAERRMKEATIAYGTLREAKPAQRVAPAVTGEEIEKRARRYREALETRKAAEEKDRARWQRWEAIEREAREKAAVEAEIAAAIARDLGMTEETRPEPPPDNVRPLGPASSTLAQRLDAARRGETAPLVPRRQTV